MRIDYCECGFEAEFQVDRTPMCDDCTAKAINHGAEIGEVPAVTLLPQTFASLDTKFKAAITQMANSLGVEIALEEPTNPGGFPDYYNNFQIGGPL